MITNEKMIESHYSECAMGIKAVTEIASLLAEQAKEMEEKKVKIGQLMLNARCSGRAHWRDDDKLYCNHSVNESCPLHGKPPKNKRLRVYVGKNKEKQQEALAAMELFAVTNELISEYKKQLREIRRIAYGLRQYANSLKELAT